MDDNVLLSRKKAPEAPTDLAGIIISRSRDLRQIVPTKINDVRKMFLLPHPAVAMAACVIMGVALGIIMPEASYYEDTGDWDSYFVVDIEGEEI